MPRENQEQSLAEILTAADIIVTPWQMANDPQGDLSDPEISHAFNQSTAQKLILPMPQKGITWIGVEPWQEKAIAREVGEAIDSIARGNYPAAARKMSPAAIVLIVLASLLALMIIVPLVITLIAALMDL